MMKTESFVMPVELNYKLSMTKKLWCKNWPFDNYNSRNVNLFSSWERTNAFFTLVIS